MSDLTVEEEIYGNIFHNPKFFEHFLSGPSTKLDAVLKYCRKTNVYAQRTNSWNPTSRIMRRTSSEPPLLKLLNTIVRGAHVASSTSSRASSIVPALFIDWLGETVETDMEKHEIPEFVLFDGITRDWPGVRTIVKLMRLPGHRKMGMVHLARYAKTMFARQPHRRHIYHIMICGTEATFVRFDRAGVLYSSVVDLCKDAETFIRALASLMMLARGDEGFHPFFSLKKNADNIIVYYLDLPDGIFHSDAEPGKTRKFQVKKILRHGNDIVGSATTVLLLREVLESAERKINPMPTRGRGKRKRIETVVEEEERFDDASYVLKIVWRDPKEVKESDLYEKTDGMYGLAQHIWADDAARRCTCIGTEEECTTCVVEVGHIEGLEVCDVLSNLIFSKREFDPNGDNKEGPELDTSKYRPATRKRLHRICSYIVMSSIGMPLGDAGTPREYMSAILDAILGYWRLFNLGYIHRDISDGNVMMLQPEQVFKRREWKNPVTELADIQDEQIRESEQKLREVVARLGRDPIGMLADFDRCVRHSGRVPVKSKSEVEFHAQRKRIAGMFNFGPRKRQRPSVTECYAFRDTSEPPSDCEFEQPVEEFRTGTMPFMSAAVLGSTFGKPYRHSYLDDLESFFWLIYLSAITHVDEGRQHNRYQLQEVAIFNNPDMRKLAKFKGEVIDRGDRICLRLDLYNNSWSKSYVFKKVLFELEDFFRDVWEEKDPGMTPAEAFTKITKFIMDGIAGP
ncbi:hypothetical protein OPQ81_003096 [Rhizoctonia solani]|nr:hypothetical protein OPQ81_003096 [Rhizoctonia solani]